MLLFLIKPENLVNEQPANADFNTLTVAAAEAGAICDCL